MKVKAFFFFLKKLFEFFYINNFLNLNIKGFKIKFKGKVNVAGNSRKRIYKAFIGQTLRSSYETRIDYESFQLSTFTGAIGIHIWLYF